MGNLEIEIAVKSSADQIWEALKDSSNLFPKIFPDLYKSAEILEGDGKSAGSVILMKYVEVEGAPAITFSKDKLQEVDNANKSLSYAVIEGEITALYKTFKTTLQVVPKGDECSVKWRLEYEKAHEEVPEPEFVKEIVVKTFQGIDDHILKA